MSSSDLLKKDDRFNLTLDADNVGMLRPGTVLQLIDCRLCRLVHKEDQTSSYRFSTRRSKPVSMLQCAVVGGKALAALAASIKNLSPQDALNWFSTGPRLVYLSLASKSIVCSPVNISSSVSVNSNKCSSHAKLSGHETDNSISDNGVHSILSLLSTYRLPIVTRPVVGLRSSEWFFMGRLTNHSLISNSDSVNLHSLLQIFSCHHGDLIFLEPLSDCSGSVYQADSSNVSGKSRFFVVTTDMLLQHNFLVADSQTCETYSRELETHAFRVSHFLAACHPVQGLTYILKHLEDISHSSNTGPSHIPLTRTLGPITNRFSTIAIQSAVTSIAAIASLGMHEEYNDIPNDPCQLNEIQPKVLNHLALNYTNYVGNNTNSLLLLSSSIDNNDFYHSTNCLNTHSSLSSSLFTSETDEMNALCDEIEDIYFYVRNGHFPMHSHSLSSLLTHQHVEKDFNVINTSAPISPYFNKLSTNQFISNKIFNDKSLTIEQTIKDQNNIKNADKYKNVQNHCNVNSKFPVKITSKAPILLIRPKLYETGSEEIKQQLTSTSIPSNQQNVWNSTQQLSYSSVHEVNNISNNFHLGDSNLIQRRPWQPLTNRRSSGIVHVVKPIQTVDNKPKVFLNTSTTTNNNNNNNHSSSVDNPTTFPLVPLTNTCNYPASVSVSSPFIAPCERGAMRLSMTAPTTPGCQSMQNTPRHYISHPININTYTTGISLHDASHCTQQPAYSTNKQHPAPLFYSPNQPGVTLSTNSLNQSDRPLFMTTSVNMSDKQNCVYQKHVENNNVIVNNGEYIYDEPRDECCQTHQRKTTYNNYSSVNRNAANGLWYHDTNHDIPSPDQSRHHLSLSASHLYPCVNTSCQASLPMYESDMSLGHVYTSSCYLANNATITTVTATNKYDKNNTASHSVNNLSSEEVTTSMVNRIEILPRMSNSSKKTAATTPTTSRVNNTGIYYFPLKTQTSTYVPTSFRYQPVQSCSPIQQPPSMPLLYPLPSGGTGTPDHASRLYQSTIVSPYMDQTQIAVHKQSYPAMRLNRQITTVTHLNCGMHNSIAPSPLPSNILLQSPKHKRTELTNSSPDTGIGVESTCDQQIVGGSFVPFNSYHSSSSSNMAVWSSTDHNYHQYCQDNTTTTAAAATTTTVNTSCIDRNSEDSSVRHPTSCRSTKFFVHNTHINSSSNNIITSKDHTISSSNQPVYRF
ncbi:unnamed protein product [Heterobilharzia americana]|nr:unnamed protein product [Heterobilharzia americana]